MRQQSAQELLSGLARAGLPRLNLAVDWHRPVWTGRPRRLMTGRRFVKTLPGDMRRLLFAKPTPSA